MSRYIEMLGFKPPTITLELRDDSFKFNPAKGIKGYFQKLAWKFLNKTHGLYNSTFETEKIEKYVIDTEKIREKLLESFFESFPQSSPKQIFIGPNEFDEILMDARNDDIIDMFSFNIDQPLYTSYNDSMGVSKYNREMLGLEVIIVPHMKGVLIV